jgi:hypothetical protein
LCGRALPRERRVELEKPGHGSKREIKRGLPSRKTP